MAARTAPPIHRIALASPRHEPKASQVMKKALEYRDRARDCRALAARAQTPEQRDQLLEMAAHWDALADDRASFVERNKGQEDGGEDER